MPHAIIEYSANLENDINLEALVDHIHDACIKTGVFPLAGMRTRAARRDNYKIANGNLQASFVHLILKIGPGRTEEIKKKAMEDIFEALSSYMKPLYDTAPVALSIEIFELPPVLRINKHNLNDYVPEQDIKVKENA